MDNIFEKELQGRVIKSGPVWVVVFDNGEVLGELLYQMVREKYNEKIKGYQLTRPFAWTAFPALQANGGMHITLGRNPDVGDKTVKFRIKNELVYFEGPRKSYINGKTTRGFVVLSVKPVDNKIKEACAHGDCHISVGQFEKIED